MRTALIASILLLAVACDKQTDKPSAEPVRDLTDLSGSPTVLFTVFGPREEPKLAPIAVLRAGKLEQITLDETGWRELDSLYFMAGSSMPIYRNGASLGGIQIARGMWPADSAPLYEVRGCRTVVPQALGVLTPVSAFDETVELLASSTPIAQPTDNRAFPMNPEAQGKTLADAVATTAGIGAEDLSELDFHARWLRTGVGPNGRTLLASYIDPNAGDLGPGAGNTSVILVMAEDSAGTFKTSYSHSGIGESRTVEFQRLVNHADLDGDGKSELVMQAWRYAGIPSIVVLRHNGVRWVEAFRVSEEWCTDR
jgi:hypothetical protein